MTQFEVFANPVARARASLLVSPVAHRPSLERMGVPLDEREIVA